MGEERVEDAQQQTPRKTMIAVFVCIAVIALVVGISLLTQAKGIRVPDLAGLDMREARTQLEIVGLGGGTVKYVDCPPLSSPHSVVYQQPERGTSVSPGSRVDVALCRD